MRGLNYVWLGHLPRDIHRDDLWSICIKHGCVKDVLLIKTISAAIVCYEDRGDGGTAGEKISYDLFQKYGKRCLATKSDWGSCFTVEVSPITFIENQKKQHENDNYLNMKHSLYEMFRPCGLIMSIDLHKFTGTALVSFSQLSEGLEASTLKPELFGKSLKVKQARFMEIFQHKIPKSKLPQGMAREELVSTLEGMVQVESYDEDSDAIHLFGSKVEINWALERIKSTEDLDTSSSSASLAKGPTFPTDLVELKVTKIPKTAGLEEVEHVFSQFGMVAQVLKDETVQSRASYKCYIRMLVTSSREFANCVIPKIDGKLALRGSALHVSQITAPKLPSNQTEIVQIRKATGEAEMELQQSEATKDNLHPEIKSTQDETLRTDNVPELKRSPAGWAHEVVEKLPDDNTKQKKDPTEGTLQDFDHLLKMTNLHHENIYDVEDNTFSSFKMCKEVTVSKTAVKNSVKLFVFGNDYCDQEVIKEALENRAGIVTMWIPSSGYSFIVIKLLPKISLSSILSISNESVSFRLALDQSLDKPSHYDHPLVEHGWMCSKARCDTYNKGLSCSKCGFECVEGNCRAAIEQVHGVVTKVFNKSRGIVAFMEPKTGREDYAFFYRGKLDLASSKQDFENIVGKCIIFNATSTGDKWEELVEDIWVCWIVTEATIAPYHQDDGGVSKERTEELASPNEDIQMMEEMSSASQNLFLWPTLVTSVTTFWAKNLDEVELLTRLEEVHDACLMREALEEVPEVDGVYGAVLAGSDKFHRVKVIAVHHIHCVEVLYVDVGCSSVRSITVMRPLPLHLTSLPAAARRYDLAGCYPVTEEDSLVYGNFYKGKEWLKKLLMGEEVRATGLLDQGKVLVDCIAKNLHVNIEVLDMGFTEQVLELPTNFKEIV